MCQGLAQGAESALKRWSFTSLPADLTSAFLPHQLLESGGRQFLLRNPTSKADWKLGATRPWSIRLLAGVLPC